MTTQQPNTLYYGDNLDILREYIATENVDLMWWCQSHHLIWHVAGLTP